jgi:predicted SAM-dependent methyltransferase
MIKANVGCGTCVAEGWVNLDNSPSTLLARRPRLRRALLAVGVLNREQAAGFPAGVVRADATALPFGDGSVDAVHSAHMIEHLPRWKGHQFLVECHRILRPGGIVRLSTPNLGTLVERYLTREPWIEGQRTAADSFVHHYGAWADISDNRVRRFIRRQFSGANHQWLYDAESLCLLLREAGFPDARERAYLDSDIPGIAAVERRPDSLFVEAVKH